MKKYDYMIISVDTEKAFDKLRYSFLMETHRKLGLDREFLHLLKRICEKDKANIILIVKLNDFPKRSRKRQGCVVSLLLLSTVLDRTE